MLVRPMMTSFVQHLNTEHGLSPLTQEAYLRQTLAVFDLAEIDNLADFTRKKLQGAMRHLRSRLAAPTVCTYVSAVRAFGRFLVEEELVEYNIAKLVTMPRCPEKEAEYFTEEEALALCAAPLAGSIDPECIRIAAIFHLLYEGGLRRSELGKIARVRYNQPKEGVALVFFLGKGEKQRSISVKSTGDVLRDYARVRRYLPFAESPALFPGVEGRPLKGAQVYYLVRKWAKLAGITRAHPHMFRHSNATHLILEGVPMTVVQKRLGHVNLATTSRYGHAGLKEQAEALDHHPLNRR